MKPLWTLSPPLGWNSSNCICEWINGSNRILCSLFVMGSILVSFSWNFLPRLIFQVGIKCSNSMPCLSCRLSFSSLWSHPWMEHNHKEAQMSTHQDSKRQFSMNINPCLSSKARHNPKYHRMSFSYQSQTHVTIQNHKVWQCLQTLTQYFKAWYLYVRFFYYANIQQLLTFARQ